MSTPFKPEWLQPGAVIPVDIPTLAAFAEELRRLYEVNQDLLKALNTILNISLIDNGHWAKTIEREAHEAIAKATGGEV